MKTLVLILSIQVIFSFKNSIISSRKNRLTKKEELSAFTLVLPNNYTADSDGTIEVVTSNEKLYQIKKANSNSFNKTCNSSDPEIPPSPPSLGFNYTVVTPPPICKSTNHTTPSRSPNKTCEGDGGDPYGNYTEVNSKGTGTCDNDNLATNVIGEIGPLNFAITEAPFNLYSCDQILIFESEILDLQDYRIRKPKWFVISAFSINIFNSRNPGDLEDSYSLKELAKFERIQGGKTCLKSLTNESKILTICMKSIEERDQIKNSINKLFECRESIDISSINSKKPNEKLIAKAFENSDNDKYLNGLLYFIKSKDVAVKDNKNNSTHLRKINHNENWELNYQLNKSIYDKYDINPAYSLREPGS